jgi:hypothetical protein
MVAMIRVRTLVVAQGLLVKQLRSRQSVCHRVKHSCCAVLTDDPQFAAAVDAVNCLF